MKSEILSVRDPTWANSTKTAINCWIRTPAYSEELPFTASLNDPEEHGREIFIRCIAGNFGEIRPHSPSSYRRDPDEPELQPDWISARPDIHDFLAEANLENARNSPRAIGLVWGSMLERMLEDFIEVQLEQQGRKGESLTYSNGKRCGSNFEARIDGAKAAKMISGDLASHLHAIRRIRNVCAHEWQLNEKNIKVQNLSNDFETLRTAYFSIYLPNDFASLVKMVFSTSCAQIIIQLAERSTRKDRSSKHLPD